MHEIRKPLSSHQFDENMYAVENPAVKATYFVQDPLLPFQFVETTINGVVYKGFDEYHFS